jgi:heme exporter protein D
MKFDYVGLAYAAFVIVLAWDYLAPRIRMAQVRRAIALRARRDAARKPGA